MSIPLTGAGSYWVRIGHIMRRLADCNALRGGAATAGVLSGGNVATATLATIIPDYTSGTVLTQATDGLTTALAGFQSTFGGMTTAGLLNTYQTLARNTLIAMYAEDVYGISSSAPLSVLVTPFSLQAAMSTLIQQMVSGGYYVQPATVSAGAQTAVGSPTGNPVVVISLKNPQGLLLQLPFPETLRFTCTADSQAGSPPAPGNETVTVTGQSLIFDQLSQNWPGGSGAIVVMGAADGSKSNSTGNLLQNSDFFTATTSNVADNWSQFVGAAGTDFFQQTSPAYTVGGGSIEFLGTGSALLDGITQSFGTTPAATVNGGGTSAKLKPDTVYHVNGWLSLTNASPAAGAAEIALTDGSAYPGVVLQDDAGTNNLFTVTLTSIADTNWHSFSGAFRTPKALPTATPVGALRIRLSTAITSGVGVYFGRVSMVQASQLYAGGPFASIHSGNVNMVNGFSPDQWTIAVSNNYRTSGSGLLQSYAEQLYGLRALGLQLPTTGSTQLADATYFV